jgi:peptidoglycan/xylan/chitin deacetylase (PgdA/CDA1 family)
MNRLRKSDYPIILFYQLGFFGGARQIMRRSLTVLNYHRIDNPERADFDTFRPNISASPSEFARQMDYVARNYNVISGTDLVSSIQSGKPLPPKSALITFDDGYLDNYTNAYPVLKSRNLPAIIFLATDFIGESKPFYWDYVAYCFHHTKKTDADLPILGAQIWNSVITRERVMLALVEALKKMPEQEKRNLVAQLPAALEVAVREDSFTRLMITWSQAREMSENGIEMGGHTASHPILTRISLAEATSELARSKQRIEDELNKPVSTFAYPNGQGTDFNPEIIGRVQQTGFKAAFTLLSGPTRYTTVARKPFEIRRIFLGHEDHFPRFVAKLSGLPRIVSRWQ